MNMNMNKSLAWGSILLALGMSTAMATTSNKGSLLIFPDIDTTDAKNTVIRITNDSSVDGISVKCYYGEYTGDDSLTVPSYPAKGHYKSSKPTIDFQFSLTPHATAYWSVEDGIGSIGVPEFDGKVGELKCWAVNTAGDNQLKFNHLFGNATVINQGDYSRDDEKNALMSGDDWHKRKHGDAYEYNAMTKACVTPGADKVPCGSVPGQLDLDNVAYQSCARYIVGSFTPRLGTIDGTSNLKHTGHFVDGEKDYDRVKAENNYLNVASCTQDLSSRDGYAEAIVHKISFDVWSHNEIKFTGAHEKADSWTRIDLGGYGTKDRWGNYTSSPLDSNKAHFTKKGVKSDAASFRAESYALPYAYKNDVGVVISGPGVAVGLVGELVRDYGKFGTSAAETTEAGSRIGEISWAPGSADAEKK